MAITNFFVINFRILYSVVPGTSNLQITNLSCYLFAIKQTTSFVKNSLTIMDKFKFIETVNENMILPNKGINH